MSELRASSSGTTWHDYIVLDGQIVGEHICNGGTPCSSDLAPNYYTLDSLNSIAVVSNMLSTERHSYDGWGRRRNIDGSDNPACDLTSITTCGFTNQEQIDSQCLVNFNARMYDPTIARFTNPDLGSTDVYDLQALNGYTYVENNPVNKVDPTGLTCETTSSGSQTCQIDQVIGNPTNAQAQQIQAFNKAYTKAVNNLASHPNRTATISVPVIGPDGKPTGQSRSTTITAGSLAKTLEGRTVVANVATSGGNALATTLGPTTVYRNGLSGAGLGGLTKGNDELGREITITHEGIHGSDEEAHLSPSGLMNGALNQYHQQPYNNAAMHLLGVPQ